jgi:hypothetical protein
MMSDTPKTETPETEADLTGVAARVAPKPSIGEILPP